MITFDTNKILGSPLLKEIHSEAIKKIDEAISLVDGINLNIKTETVLNIKKEKT